MPLFSALQRWYCRYEQVPKTTGIISVIVLGSLGILGFFWGLGSGGLVDETEPMFAEAARRMGETGDWITPYYNEATRFDKPPLVYWCMAIAYKILGVNAWGARLPSALAAAGLMVLLFLVLRRFGVSSGAMVEAPSDRQFQRKKWWAAWIGSGLMALNLHTIVWARTGVSDMLLNGCMGAALLCFFQGYGSGGRAIAPWFPNGWYGAAYVFLGLAVLTKGPVGVVLPGLIIIAFLVYVGKFWEVFWEAKPLTGAIAFLGISVPWFVLVTLRNGQAYIDSFFGYHNFERFTEVVNGHDAPWYFYFPVVLVGFVPWSLYLPAAIARLKLHRWGQWRQQPRAAHLGVFASVWFGMIFLFFSVAVTKLPSYTIPLLPAASILVALLWSHWLEESSQRAPGFHWTGWMNVVVMAALAGFMIHSPQVVGFDPAAPQLDQQFSQSTIPLKGALVWGSGAIAGGFFLVRRSRLGLWLTNVTVMVGFIALVFLPLGSLIDHHRQEGLRELAATIRTQRLPGEEVVMIGFEKPSLVFYTQKPVRFFYEHRSAIAYFQEDLGTEEPSVLLVAGDSTLVQMPLTPDQAEILQVEAPYQLLRIHQPHTVALPQ